MAAALLVAGLFAALMAQQPPPSTGSSSSAQDAPSSPQQSGSQTTIKVPVNQVLVPVTVKDGAGRLVPDLRLDEFRIFEDNVEQKIAFFRADVIPISMVVLLDNDLKSKDAKQVGESVRAIVAGMSLNDEAFICRFDQYFHPGKGFASDQDKLLTELKRTHLDEQPSVGPTSAAIGNGPSINGHSATGDAPNINGGLIILLISDGLNGPKANKFNYDTTLKELLRYDIAVYGVGVGSAFFERRFERLSKYAHATGGDVYYGLKSRAMEELYGRVTEEARNQYMLAYAPGGTDRAKEYHAVEVRVRREGLTILARQGYYAGAAPR